MSEYISFNYRLSNLWYASVAAQNSVRWALNFIMGYNINGIEHNSLLVVKYELDFR